METEKVIGFAEQYYTLWNVVKTKVHMNKFQSREVYHFTYIKNLSKELKKAEEKVKGPFTLDLSLKGEKRNFYTHGEPQGVIPDTVFKFGKYQYLDIESSKDISYLKWYYSETNNQHALKVLLDNGFKFINDTLYPPDVFEKIKHSLGLKRGHLFEDKKRVELKIKTVKEFSFESHFGTTFIRLYETECGKEVKYMGSNPPEISDEVFETVMATIKHDNYNDIDETKIQRIKLKNK